MCEMPRLMLNRVPPTDGLSTTASASSLAQDPPNRRARPVSLTT
jgi:hypothetical protein